MTADMIDADQRLACRIGQRFRFRHTDQQRPDQTRPVGDRDRIDLVHRGVRFRQSLRNAGVDRFQVFARSDLRHDASVQFVRADL